MKRSVQLRGGQLLLTGILLCCLFMMSSPLKAQDWSFAVGPGVASFLGDASQQQLSTPGFALNAEAWYYLNDRFQLKSGLSFYRIRATDTDTMRLRSFDATNFELYTSLLYYFPKAVVQPSPTLVSVLQPITRWGPAVSASGTCAV